MPRSKILLLFLLATVSAGAFMGSRGIYQTTEGRYAEVAREMIQTGNYLVPTLNFQPHWTKPPLTYWAIAASMSVAGKNPWGVRLPNLAFFTLTVFAVGAIAMTLYDEATAVLAATIYATSPFAVAGASIASTDTPLAFFEAVMVLCYLRGRFGSPAPRARLWMSLMWLFAGLCFMTKGPPGLLPLIPILAWHYCRSTDNEQLTLFPIAGLTGFVAIGFAWYIVVSIRYQEVLSYWLKSELADRVVGQTEHHYSQWYQPFVLYLPALVLGTGVWIWILTAAAFRSTQPRITAWRDKLKIGSREGLLLLWILIPLTIFSVVNSRLPLYVLPLLSPVAVLVARALVSTMSTASLRRTAPRVAVASALIFTAARWAVPNYYSSRNDMAALYQLCRSAGAESAKIYSFEKPLSGLQFYLDGGLTRLSLSESECDAVPAASVIQSRGSWQIICDNQKLADLEAALGPLTKYKRVENKYWTVLVSGPAETAGNGTTETLDHE